MDMNFWVIEEMIKFNKEEMDREIKFKETYKLYSNSSRKKYCVDLKVIKLCI
jgi:hypothetical protein